MRTLQININESVYEKVYSFLSSFPKEKVQIVEDWSHLEPLIDDGVNSGVSERTHEEIVRDLKAKYVQD